MLSSEFSIIENPFEATEPVTGLFLLNKNLFLHTHLKYAEYDMRGNLLRQAELKDVGEGWELLCRHRIARNLRYLVTSML